MVRPLVEGGITPVIPPKRNRSIKRLSSFAFYKQRDLIERFFNKLEQFRTITTRYDKTARNVLASTKLAAATIPLK